MKLLTLQFLTGHDDWTYFWWEILNRLPKWWFHGAESHGISSVKHLTSKKSKQGNQGMAIQIRKYPPGFASIGCNALFDYGNSMFPNMLYILTKCCWIWANYIKEITNSNWRISFLHHVFLEKWPLGRDAPSIPMTRNSASLLAASKVSFKNTAVMTLQFRWEGARSPKWTARWYVSGNFLSLNKDFELWYIFYSNTCLVF